MNEYTKLAQRCEQHNHEHFADLHCLLTDCALTLRRIGEAMEAGGLADERIDDIADEFMDDEHRICASFVYDFARAIEQEVTAPLLTRIAELVTEEARA